MAHRIEVVSTIPDTRAEARRRGFLRLGFKVDRVEWADIYTIDAELARPELEKVATALANPVTERAHVDSPYSPAGFDWAVETGFLPGVTDNVANTTKETIEDLLGRRLAEGEGVYTSQLLFLWGGLTGEEARSIAEGMANPVINRTHVKSRAEFGSGGMGVEVPRVSLKSRPEAGVVKILGLGDEELARMGKEGIRNPDGSTRGPLALDLTYMKAIQRHFEGKGRNPTDIELEAIAQTWSEHCKHTIFSDSIDEVKDGLFRAYIKAATNRVRQMRGTADICVSVFTDNSGAIAFDERFLVTDKVETHNSPSALDPFGGAITGIVGVNRDAIGVGLGAKPIINRYGFCFADPGDESPLYKGANKTQRMLQPRRIMDGVIDGVKVGGNCSGIPTPDGFVFFDGRYKGKPLVFVGTVGLLPRMSAGRPACEKRAMPGDLIVMAGGRVGKDGIHGATFSSEAIDSGSPVTAVQIGDPITQKRLSDAVVKEARDMALYTSITDNGAGGLSCSVAEMAKESGGCTVKLDEVPLKYPGLAPWEIWVSESQERMTLAVPKGKWPAFSDLMKRRGVEATVIGEFTGSGRCVVEHHGKVVLDIEMKFLHEGLPPRPLHTSYTRPVNEEPQLADPADWTPSLHSMLRRNNVAGFRFISRQYDHEVQGGSVIKPLQGRGEVNGDATVTRPLLDSDKGVILSHGLNPGYSDIDTYHMAACAIDTAMRNAVAVGADPDRVALLDNFCWCSSNDPERLGQLKEAVRACYDMALEYRAPFISGKDSMFNDFKGYDADGRPVKISVPPTLLVSTIAVMEDSRKAVSLDAKLPGDLVYVLGSTGDELGGSEYLAMLGEQERGKGYTGNSVPKVSPAANIRLYKALARAIGDGLVASCQSVHRGGLAIALAKTAMAGRLGMEVDLGSLPGDSSGSAALLYSESQGRLVATVAPADRERFEKAMAGSPIALAGRVREDGAFVIRSRGGREIIRTDVEDMLKSYHLTFEGY